MSDSSSGISLSNKTRAQRFELQIPVRYRTDSEQDWHRGTTRNISRSGMLLHGEDWAQPSTRIELTLLLPRQMGVTRAAEVMCRGTVTRSERRGIDQGGPLMAIRISHYRLIRPRDAKQLDDNGHH
jgi:hypothetical protein